MFTNGTLIDRFNLFETFVTCLKWVRISMDAGIPSTYNDLRKTNKNNDFNKVIKNIKTLIDIQKKFKSDIIIGVGFVVMN